MILSKPASAVESSDLGDGYGIVTGRQRVRPRSLRHTSLAKPCPNHDFGVELRQLLLGKPWLTFDF